VKVLNVPRVWRKPRNGLRAAACGGARRASPAAKRAFCYGIVKNQRGLAFGSVANQQAVEILHCWIFHISRDKSSSENFSRSARLAQTAKRFASSRLRRRSAGFARRQTRVLPRYREKSAGRGFRKCGKSASGENSELLNFSQSRDKSSRKKTNLFVFPSSTHKIKLELIHEHTHYLTQCRHADADIIRLLSRLHDYRHHL
jgi:hypothetical protein